ncbi:MAG: hypothetical protein ACI4TJ_07085 [Candidatus Cryptobacteroides sp.]
MMKRTLSTILLLFAGLLASAQSIRELETDPSVLVVTGSAASLDEADSIALSAMAGRLAPVLVVRKDLSSAQKSALMQTFFSDIYEVSRRVVEKKGNSLIVGRYIPWADAGKVTAARMERIASLLSAAEKSDNDKDAFDYYTIAVSLLNGLPDPESMKYRTAGGEDVSALAFVRDKVASLSRRYSVEHFSIEVPTYLSREIARIDAALSPERTVKAPVNLGRKAEEKPKVTILSDTVYRSTQSRILVDHQKNYHPDTTFVIVKYELPQSVAPGNLQEGTSSDASSSTGAASVKSVREPKVRERKMKEPKAARERKPASFQYLMLADVGISGLRTRNASDLFTAGLTFGIQPVERPVGIYVSLLSDFNGLQTTSSCSSNGIFVDGGSQIWTTGESAHSQILAVGGALVRTFPWLSFYAGAATATASLPGRMPTGTG